MKHLPLFLSFAAVFAVLMCAVAQSETKAQRVASTRPAGGLLPVRWSEVTGGRSVGDLTHLSPAAKELWATYATPQGRLRAAHDATEDAMQRLATHVLDVHVGPTSVRDLIARSKDPNADPSVFLRGARPTGVRYWADAPVVEVQVAASMRTVYALLKLWAQTHVDDKVMILRLEELAAKAGDSKLTALGFSAPPAEYLTDAAGNIHRVAKRARNTPDWVGGRTAVTTRPATAPTGDGIDARPDTTDTVTKWRSVLRAELERAAPAEATTQPAAN
jgi:hypothetical protein